MTSRETAEYHAEKLAEAQTLAIEAMQECAETGMWSRADIEACQQLLRPALAAYEAWNQQQDAPQVAE